jgi:signal transduction histidine kinase
MLEKTGRLGDWNSRRLEAMEERMREQFEDLVRREQRGMMVFLLAGLALAGFVYHRITALSQEANARLAQAEELSARLLRVQEEERKAVARELHDGVAQNLSALKLGLDRLGKQQDEPAWQELRGLAEESLKMTRNLSLVLRPSMLDDLGLEAALRWQVREWQRREGLRVDLQTVGPLEDLDEERRLCVFRLVQEAVQNALRHGEASEVQIQVAREPQRLLVSVQDNGRSFDPAKEKGLGIMGMTERVQKLGGTLSIASRPGVGTVVMAELR